MKSRICLSLALLLVFSAGIVSPLQAAEARYDRVDVYGEPDTPTRTVDPTDDPSDETQGDPDGWLGGQNFAPTKPNPDGSGLMVEPDSETSDTFVKTMEQLILRTMLYVGLR
jgi:hypothetical protein